MLKDVLKAVLRVLAGTVFILALAATIGIPAGNRGPAAAQPGDEPRGLDLNQLNIAQDPQRGWTSALQLPAGRPLGN